MNRAVRAIFGVVAMAACGGSGSAPAAAPAAPVEVGPPTLAEVEAALLAAPVWRVEATIHSEGVFAADLFAIVLATPDNRVRLEASGTFAGRPAMVRWISDGARISGDEATPPHTTEAIVYGLTRMGLLHNVARLMMGGAAPDHAEGGAASWVVATDPHPAGDGVVAFGLTVDGKPSGDAHVTLTRGPDGPVMTGRRLEVRFKGVEMFVAETYQFDLAAEPASDAFVIGGRP